MFIEIRISAQHDFVYINVHQITAIIPYGSEMCAVLTSDQQKYVSHDDISTVLNKLTTILNNK